jgi:hypothetical protein
VLIAYHISIKMLGIPGIPDNRELKAMRKISFQLKLMKVHCNLSTLKVNHGVIKLSE